MTRLKRRASRALTATEAAALLDAIDVLRSRTAGELTTDIPPAKLEARLRLLRLLKSARAKVRGIKTSVNVRTATARRAGRGRR